MALGLLLTVTAPAWGHVQLVAPNGGELLQPGETYTIMWDELIHHNLLNWDIYYSTSGPNGPWLDIAVDWLPAVPPSGSVFSYEWTVPDILTEQARVRIVQDNEFFDYEDVSDGDFLIGDFAVPDTFFVDVSMVTEPGSAGAAGTALASDESTVDDLQKIVVLCSVPDEGVKYLKAIGVNGTTGREVGGVADIQFPPSPCYTPIVGFPPEPIHPFLSEYFLPGELIVLMNDNALYHTELVFSSEVPPEPILWNCVAPPDDGLPWGEATAIGELPGSLFGDSQPRLFMGTDMGQLLLFINTPDGPVMESTWDVATGEPITAIGPIPQYGEVLLGVAAGNSLYGLHSNGTVQFALTHPDGAMLADFGAFGSPYEPLTSRETPVLLPFTTMSSTGGGPEWSPPDHIVLPAQTAGTGQMTIEPDGSAASMSLTLEPYLFELGSFLVLDRDSGTVMYYPNYSESNGLGDCGVNLFDGLADACSCCNGTVGDPNGVGGDEPSIGDISTMIDALFISGNATPIACLAEADINQSGGGDPPYADITIGDISILIDYLFITGPTLGLPDCL
jgi:hypothetical protein